MHVNFMTSAKSIFWGKFNTLIPGHFEPPDGKPGQVAENENGDDPSANASKTEVFCAPEKQDAEKDPNILIKCHPLHKLGRSQPCKFNVNY